MATDPDPATLLAAAAPAAGAIYVHLCSGEHREIPATVVALRGDKLVLLDAGGREVARFSARDVYMCARSRLPAVPL